jgi:hypothetical protein
VTVARIIRPRRVPVIGGDVPGSPDIMADYFERTLELSASSQGQATTAMAAGGWSAVKCTNGGNPMSGGGTVSITDTVPGYVGTYPGVGRCLRLHGTPADIEPGVPFQTDFYVQGRDFIGGLANINPNHWGQMFVYMNHSGSELSNLNDLRSKFIYGNASASLGAEGSLMFFIGQETFQTLWNSGWTVTNPGDFFIGMRPWYNSGNNTGANYPPFGAGDTDKISANLANKPVRRNRWTLFRYHLNVSGSVGLLRYWLRDMVDDADLVPVALWDGGVLGAASPSGFEWNTNATDRAGVTHFRMPTVIQSPRDADPIHEIFMYIRAFEMASQSSLLTDYA